MTLAINRGENLKILSVKVNIPDYVKADFCRWCVNVRWRPLEFARPELMKILNSAVEDSYKRLLLPMLSRSYRTKLTTSAEKESVAMFVRNLRQRLLVCPVRGRMLMGVDPGYRHGCKLAILSPTSQILHTDVVYLHGSGRKREADKLRHLMLKHSCQTVVIGNGTACRETESFFADLIKSGFFKPLDVSYCDAQCVKPDILALHKWIHFNLHSKMEAEDLRSLQNQHCICCQTPVAYALALFLVPNEEAKCY
ncbi:S1 RNA-binding domain-containing protein 1 isoform X1 [Tachysurus ichikawai]